MYWFIWYNVYSGEALYGLVPGMCWLYLVQGVLGCTWVSFGPRIGSSGRAVWLGRLTLCTMGGIGDKPQKEGETPLLASHLAKLSNSQTIASLFGQGENNCAPNQKKEYIIMKMKMSSRVHNVSDEVGLICMCTKPKCAKT